MDRIHTPLWLPSVDMTMAYLYFRTTMQVVTGPEKPCMQQNWHYRDPSMKFMVFEEPL